MSEVRNEKPKYENESFFQVANQNIIMSFNQSTDEDFSKLIITASQIDKNKKSSLYMRHFIDKDEFKGVMSLISNGMFPKVTFDNANKPGHYVLYGGSKSGGTTMKRQGNNLVKVLQNKPESRIMQMYFKDMHYYLNLDAYPGKIIRNGAITKAGEKIGGLYYKFSTNQIYTLAAIAQSL